MGAEQELKEIDNYEQAYNERLKEFMLMKENKKRIMTMHLGGVVIECLLKSIIIKEHSITKYKHKKDYWYSNKTYNYLVGIGNPGDEYKEKLNAKNPKHSYSDAIKQIEKLNSIIQKDMIEKFEFIETPFEKEKVKYDFIALRYLTDDQILEELYKEWEMKFIEIHNWINKNKKS